jgi:hypothetical protein
VLAIASSERRETITVCCLAVLFSPLTLYRAHHLPDRYKRHRSLAGMLHSHSSRKESITACSASALPSNGLLDLCLCDFVRVCSESYSCLSVPVWQPVASGDLATGGPGY